MDGPSRTAKTAASRYASPPPEARRPFGDVTNRGLKTPPRQISADCRMELMKSPSRKPVAEKENSSAENTPERKISDVTNRKSPSRDVPLDAFSYLPMPESTEGKSVFGNQDSLVNIRPGSLLPSEDGLDTRHAFSDFPEGRSFHNVAQSLDISAAPIGVLETSKKTIRVPPLSSVALGIAPEAAEVSQEPFISPEKFLELRAELIPESIGLTDFLSKKGVNVGSRLGKGANGVAYETTVNDEAPESISSSAPMIYKKENKPRLLTDIESKPKFWRHHDASVARLDLPHVVKPVAFLVLVEMYARKTERFYVPADKIKEFGALLPADASVKMEAQLSEKAPGKNLAELIKEDRNFFHPGGPHFAKVVCAVDEFLRAAYTKNFIHRDLKPANIMYDSLSGKVTIIDTGEASRLRRRGKSDEEVVTPRHIAEGRHSNPTGSRTNRGTRCFMAPSINKTEKYGSEVDFFSAGMLFLNLISPSPFEEIKSKKASFYNDLFHDKDPSAYLEIFLNNIPQNTETLEILEEHPYLRKLISSYLQISAINTPGSEQLLQVLMTESKNVVDHYF